MRERLGSLRPGLATDPSALRRWLSQPSPFWAETHVDRDLFPHEDHYSHDPLWFVDFEDAIIFDDIIRSNSKDGEIEQYLGDFIVKSTKYSMGMPFLHNSIISGDKEYVKYADDAINAIRDGVKAKEESLENTAEKLKKSVWSTELLERPTEKRREDIQSSPHVPKECYWQVFFSRLVNVDPSGLHLVKALVTKNGRQQYINTYLDKYEAMYMCYAIAAKQGKPWNVVGDLDVYKKDAARLKAKIEHLETSDPCDIKGWSSKVAEILYLHNTRHVPLIYSIDSSPTPYINDPKKPYKPRLTFQTFLHRIESLLSDCNYLGFAGIACYLNCFQQTLKQHPSSVTIETKLHDALKTSQEAIAKFQAETIACWLTKKSKSKTKRQYSLEPIISIWEQKSGLMSTFLVEDMQKMNGLTLIEVSKSIEAIIPLIRTMLNVSSDSINSESAKINTRIRSELSEKLDWDKVDGDSLDHFFATWPSQFPSEAPKLKTLHGLLDASLQGHYTDVNKKLADNKEQAHFGFILTLGHSTWRSNLYIKLYLAIALSTPLFRSCYDSKPSPLAIDKEGLQDAAIEALNFKTITSLRNLFHELKEERSQLHKQISLEKSLLSRENYHPYLRSRLYLITVGLSLFGTYLHEYSTYMPGIQSKGSEAKELLNTLVAEVKESITRPT